MARLPYTNFHDINLDWLIKRVMPAYTPDNPPPYPVKSVNGKTGSVLLTGGDIPFSEEYQNVTVLDFCDFALEQFENIQIDLGSKQDAPALAGSPGDVLSLDADQNPVWSTPAAGTDDYNDLQNKPQINGVTVSGNKTGADFGLLNAALARMMYAPIITDTASGDPASFPDGIADMPMEVLASIEPVQDLHGYANPWPAGGGKNLFPNTLNSITVNGITITKNTDGTYTANSAGVTEETDIYINSIDGIFNIDNGLELPTEQYKISAVSDGSNTTYRFYSRTHIEGQSDNYTGANTGEITLNITSGQTIFVFVRFYQGAVINNLKIYPMIRLASISDATFAPYANICPITGHAGLTLYTSGSDTSNPDVYPVAWGDVAGTVYGGTFNSKTGKLIVTHAAYTFTGNESWTASPTPNRFSMTISSYLANPLAVQPTITNAVQDIVSSIFGQFVYKNADGVCYVYNAGTTFTLVVNTSVASTTNEIKALFANTQIVYELDTPIEYDLYSINNLKTLYGDNNVWTDVGTVSVDYYADTKLFILKVI